MTKLALTRRRFLAISAAATATPFSALSASRAVGWTGVALGAPASIVLTGLSEAEAAPIFASVEAEIARLERLFSLFQADSELSWLNRTGALTTPSPEMLELLSRSSAIYIATGGAFDPTVQPLWRAYAEAQAGAPDAATLEAARSAIGWRFVDISTRSVRFRKPGMALTLNGIAQGYIADLVADLLRHAGLRDVLVDMGEVSALGARPDGKPWRAGIAAPGGEILAKAALKDRSLATSAPKGTLMNRHGDGHILDPRTGAPGGKWSVVSVSAANAATADGLSTAFCLLTREETDATLREFPDARLELLR